MAKRMRIVSVGTEKSGMWSVTKSWNRSGRALFDKKNDAIWYARKIAEVEINKDGCTIRFKESGGKYAVEPWDQLTRIKNSLDSLAGKSPKRLPRFYE